MANGLLSDCRAFGKSDIEDSKKRFPIFVAIAVVGMGINSAIIRLFEELLAKSEIFEGIIAPGNYYMTGKIAARVIVFVRNFTSRKLLIYRRPKKAKIIKGQQAGFIHFICRMSDM